MILMNGHLRNRRHGVTMRMMSIMALSIKNYTTGMQSNPANCVHKVGIYRPWQNGRNLLNSWGDSLALAAMIKNDPLWKAGTTPNNNQSQFSALPGGRRQENGSFIYEGTDAYFWASDESSQEVHRQSYYVRKKVLSFDCSGRKFMDLVVDV